MAESTKDFAIALINAIGDISKNEAIAALQKFEEHLVTRFVEFIGKYEGGENLDFVMNIEKIIFVRVHPDNPEDTMIHFAGQENPVRVCMPYRFVLNAIRSAEQ